ncbi:hypothetical protein GCM10018980_18940 [Streptomyces capoamus]|uniref:Uncharacterized protein n=1 Tax=Streptomyces capoamus TaxID=68183 RepID=A0A919EWA9_9ACTN|nr:hypothetical protein GCM10018980_18940 [Streptomyces capoamus]
MNPSSGLILAIITSTLQLRVLRTQPLDLLHEVVDAGTSVGCWARERGWAMGITGGVSGAGRHVRLPGLLFRIPVPCRTSQQTTGKC